MASTERFPDLAGLLESVEVDGARADFVSFGYYRPEYWRNNWHRHSFHEVCLAYAGDGTFRTGGAQHDVGAGTAFLARPDDVHEIESSRSDPLGIAFWSFAFRPAAGMTGPGWWSGLTAPGGPVVSTRVGSLPSLVGALAAEAGAPRSGYAASLGALGTALVVETARAFASESDLATRAPRRERGSVLVAAMEKHLADNLGRPITVGDVAAVVHLSERHAERLFRQQTGVSLMSALRRLRMEQAAALLLDPGMTVSQTAKECGYTEVRAFSTAFRRYHGTSPSAFRAGGGTQQLGPA